MQHASNGRPWLLYGLLTTSLALNLYMVTNRTPPARPRASPRAPPAPAGQYQWRDGAFHCGQVNVLVALTDIGPGDGASCLVPCS